MAEQRKRIAACLGKLGGDKARESLRRLFAGKGVVKEVSYKVKQSDDGRGFDRGGDGSFKLQVRRFEKEAESNSVPALW